MPAEAADPPPASGSELCYLPALDLRDRYRRRELSPVEVTAAVLDRIDALQPRLNAFVTVTRDRALQQAQAAERAYRDGGAGPLAGIPLSLKDLVPTRGVRTTMGSLLQQDWVPDFDAPVAERLLGAGGVLLGKTNTPEYGWKGETSNRVSGTTHNPWRHGRTPGGSSGGAAAAVAAGLGPIAQGSDGAGSIRIPSSFSGIFGIKPSFGLVPQYPASAVELLSHVGPMTRTVRDAALMLGVMAGADPRDPHSWSQPCDYLARLQEEPERPRTGRCASPGRPTWGRRWSTRKWRPHRGRRAALRRTGLRGGSGQPRRCRPVAADQRAVVRRRGRRPRRPVPGGA